ncbi:MAG: four helix bundle protein [Burkholderiales bacterium]
MSTVGSHRDLIAWQEAMNLVESVYQETAVFPREETYVLTSQTHRAAISVPSNIAEGAARNFGRELYRHLGIAMGSLAELETHLELAMRLNYLPRNTELFKQARRVGRLVNGLRNACGKWPTRS